METSMWNFGQNWEFNCIPLHPRLKDNANLRLNQMIIRWIYIKIKSDDLIKVLIGQFNLIMDLIKGLLKLYNQFESNSKN